MFSSNVSDIVDKDSLTLPQRRPSQIRDCDLTGKVQAYDMQDSSCRTWNSELVLKW
jgi:hypothetical protein